MLFNNQLIHGKNVSKMKRKLQMDNSQNSLINNSLDIYFTSVLQGWNASNSRVLSQPMAHYLLPSLLLQMTGFIEQKYDAILWEIGYNKYNKRFDIFKDWQSIGIHLDKYKQVYEFLLSHKIITYTTGKKAQQEFPKNMTLFHQISNQYQKTSEYVVEKLIKNKIYPNISFIMQQHDSITYDIKSTLISQKVFSDTKKKGNITKTAEQKNKEESKRIDNNNENLTTLINSNISTTIDSEKYSKYHADLVNIENYTSKKIKYILESTIDKRNQIAHFHDFYTSETKQEKTKKLKEKRHKRNKVRQEKRDKIKGIHSGRLMV